MPFASRAAADFRPADYIAEGLDQTRGWFYTMAVLGTALFDAFPYKQVIVNGLVLAEDGKKMSKRLKNYPELTEVLDKYGADALRYYLVSSSAVRAEDLAFSEKSLDEVAKKVIGRLENVVSFYELYAQQSATSVESEHVLDKWIDARFAKLLKEVTESLESYELDRASRPLAGFVDDLSTWYLRRSRTRPEVLPKLREILLNFARVMAPFMPFIAEDIHQRLKGNNNEESVHLEMWPQTEKSFLDAFRKNKGAETLLEMDETRRIVSLALEARSKANIKVRQPLSELRIKNSELGPEFLKLIKDELNVKHVVVDKSIVQEVELDTDLTSKLIEEGKLRDMIRSIQDMRKEKGLKPGEIMVFNPPTGEKELFRKHAPEIEKMTNIKLES